MDTLLSKSNTDIIISVRILGIDPGTARLGYALLDLNESKKELLTCGIVSTSKMDTESQRLAEIRRDLKQVIDKYKPDYMSVEKLFFFKNLKTVIPVAQARGVILELAASSGIPVYEYTPLQVKQIMTGNGRAAKLAVETMVMHELGIKTKIRPDDAIDAIALALCLLRGRSLKL